MRPSLVQRPVWSAVRRALILFMAACLAFGIAVVSPPQRVSAQPQGVCGIAFNCVTVTVAPFGNGSGTAVAKYLGDGINCHYANGVLTGTCAYEFKWAGTGWLYIGLTYTPDAHSGLCFQSAELTCYGAGVSQTENLGFSPTAPPDTEQAYGFSLLAQTVTVTRTGVGSGTVASSVQPGIACGATCSAQFDYGTSVKLTAKPDAGAVFTAWTGACAGQGKTCTIKMTADLATNAVFSLPSPTPAPTPRPTVAATPAATAALPSAAPASAAPPSSSQPASPGAPTDSPTPADSGLTAIVGTAASPGTPAPQAQTPVAASADAGVPVVLVVVLVLMALLIGGLAAALALVLRRGKAS